jgi:hypothetical protein
MYTTRTRTEKKRKRGREYNWKRKRTITGRKFVRKNRHIHIVTTLSE